MGHVGASYKGPGLPPGLQELRYPWISAAELGGYRYGATDDYGRKWEWTEDDQGNSAGWSYEDLGGSRHYISGPDINGVLWDSWTDWNGNKHRGQVDQYGNVHDSWTDVRTGEVHDEVHPPGTIGEGEQRPPEEEPRPLPPGAYEKSYLTYDPTGTGGTLIGEPYPGMSYDPTGTGGTLIGEPSGGGAFDMADTSIGYTFDPIPTSGQEPTNEPPAQQYPSDEPATQPAPTEPPVEQHPADAYPPPAVSGAYSSLTGEAGGGSIVPGEPALPDVLGEMLPEGRQAQEDQPPAGEGDAGDIRPVGEPELGEAQEGYPMPAQGGQQGREDHPLTEPVDNEPLTRPPSELGSLTPEDPALDPARAAGGEVKDPQEDFVEGF